MDSTYPSSDPCLFDSPNFYFLSFSETYLSHPSCSSVSTLASTSSSSSLAYDSMATARWGIDVPMMRHARRAALVELLIPTVAVGMPR